MKVIVDSEFLKTCDEHIRYIIYFKNQGNSGFVASELVESGEEDHQFSLSEPIQKYHFALADPVCFSITHLHSTVYGQAGQFRVHEFPVLFILSRI